MTKWGDACLNNVCSSNSEDQLKDKASFLKIFGQNINKPTFEQNKLNKKLYEFTQRAWNFVTLI